jgi:hypothetical protein
MLFAYFTPEVIMPVASVLAGAFGVILMVGRAPLRYAARGARWIARGWKKTVDRFGL